MWEQTGHTLVCSISTIHFVGGVLLLPSIGPSTINLWLLNFFIKTRICCVCGFSPVSPSLLQEKFITLMYVPCKFCEDSCTLSLRGHNLWTLRSTNNLYKSHLAVYEVVIPLIFIPSLWNIYSTCIWPLIFLWRITQLKTQLPCWKPVCLSPSPSPKC